MYMNPLRKELDRRLLREVFDSWEDCRNCAEVWYKEPLVHAGKEGWDKGLLS